MKISKFQFLNKLIAIIDSCQADCTISLNSTWTEDEYNPEKNLRAKKLLPFVNSEWQIILTKKNKSEIIDVLAEYFSDADFYHAFFRIGSKLKGESYDHSDFVILNPNYFKLTEEHLKVLDDSEVKLTEDINE